MTIAMLATALITGCSSSPSETEAKNAVESQWVSPGCNYVSVENFKKINGTQINDRTYSVDVSYSINMKPTPDNLKMFSAHEARVAANDIEVPSTKAKLEAYEDGMAGILPTTAPDGHKLSREEQRYTTEWDSHMKEHPDGLALVIAYNDANETRKILHATPTFFDSNVRQMFQDFSAVCTWPLSSYQKVIGNNSIFDAMGKGISTEFTQTIQMIKTDNGWMGAK